MSFETLTDNSSNDTEVKTPARKVTKKKSAGLAADNTDSIGSGDNIPRSSGNTKKSGLKKLEPETVKLLTLLRDKANRKEFGRKVRDTEIIHLALSLIDAHHIEALKETTYSEQDRLRFTHLEYQKAHGKISLDQFIGKLLKGEIQPFTKS